MCIMLTAEQKYIMKQTGYKLNQMVWYNTSEGHKYGIIMGITYSEDNGLLYTGIKCTTLSILSLNKIESLGISYKHLVNGEVRIKENKLCNTKRIERCEKDEGINSFWCDEVNKGDITVLAEGIPFGSTVVLGKICDSVQSQQYLVIGLNMVNYNACLTLVDKEYLTKDIEIVSVVRKETQQFFTTNSSFSGTHKDVKVIGSVFGINRDNKKEIPDVFKYRADFYPYNPNLKPNQIVELTYGYGNEKEKHYGIVKRIEPYTSKGHFPYVSKVGSPIVTLVIPHVFSKALTYDNIMSNSLEGYFSVSLPTYFVKPLAELCIGDTVRMRETDFLYGNLISINFDEYTQLYATISISRESKEASRYWIGHLKDLNQVRDTPAGSLDGFYKKSNEESLYDVSLKALCPYDVNPKECSTLGTSDTLCNPDIDYHRPARDNSSLKLLSIEEHKEAHRVKPNIVILSKIEHERSHPFLAFSKGYLDSSEITEAPVFTCPFCDALSEQGVKPINFKEDVVIGDCVDVIIESSVITILKTTLTTGVALSGVLGKEYSSWEVEKVVRFRKLQII